MKNAESPKFCQTESINRYHEKKMIDTHLKTRLRVKNSVREKMFNRRNNNGGLNKSEKAQKMKGSDGMMRQTCALDYTSQQKNFFSFMLGILE